MSALLLIHKKKLSAILLLCDQGYSLHADTLMAYAIDAQKLAAQLNDRLSGLKALYYKSAALTNKGLIDSSLQMAENCMQLLQEGDTDIGLEANICNQKGRCYVRMNNYKEAIEMGYAVISKAEKVNDVLLQVKGKTLIGWAYLEMGQLKDALNWHLQALHTTNDSILLGKYGILLANISTNYNNLGNADSDFYYIKKGVHYSRIYQNLFALSNSLAIQSSLHVKAGQPKLSEPLLKEVVAIRKEIGDPFYTASDMAQLGYYYAHYGEPEKGIAVCNEGIALAKKYNLTTKLFFLYSSLADNYKAMGNIDLYSTVMNDIIQLKDSVYEKNSVHALAELQTKYDVQKKENTIIQQKLNIVQKNYWLYGSMIVAAFSILLFYLAFQLYKKKQKMKMVLALAEEKRLSATAVKEAEENERRRIAADLHDNLGAYAASIMANIDTLSAELQFNPNTTAAMHQLRSNSQSIVSQIGDTIWALKRTALSLTTVSDRIKLVIQKVAPSHPHLKFDVLENITTDCMLPPVQAFHLFQTIQEAIINAIKHSGGSTITVSFISHHFWQVIIEDDGTGMPDMPTTNNTGNGINNMKARAKEAGFTISWLPGNISGIKVMIQPTAN